MKKIYLAVSIIGLTIGFSISALAQLRKPAPRKAATSAYSNAANMGGTGGKSVSTNRSPLIQSNQIKSPKDPASGQATKATENHTVHIARARKSQGRSNSVIFEPNNEPLWLKGNRNKPTIQNDFARNKHLIRARGNNSRKP